MNRAVYIGGFGNGRMSAVNVAEELTPAFFDEVDVFTFAEAMKNPEQVRRAINGVPTITHSAGIMALKGTRPDSIDAFAAPLPTTVRHLVGRTLAKTVQMHKRPLEAPILDIAMYDASAVAELAVHPAGNLKYLRQIAQFNAIGAAIEATDTGISTYLYYNQYDAYYQPNELQRHRADMRGVPVLSVPGLHDQFPLTPQSQIEHTPNVQY